MENRLTQLVEFYGRKLDILAEVQTEKAKGQYLAYSIAKRMTENIVYEILDRQLADMLKDGGDVAI